jgi:hypothetical protein
MCRILEITTTSGCSYCALDGRNNDTPYAEGAKRETMLASESSERVGNVSELLKLAAASVENWKWQPKQPLCLTSVYRSCLRASLFGHPGSHTHASQHHRPVGVLSCSSFTPVSVTEIHCLTGSKPICRVPGSCHCLLPTDESELFALSIHCLEKSPLSLVFVTLRVYGYGCDRRLPGDKILLSLKAPLIPLLDLPNLALWLSRPSPLSLQFQQC